MKVNEIFESIQGEGAHSGVPVLFIRLSGCTRACSFCDTKYHTDGKDMTVNEVVERINKSKLCTVVWTGGEPALQADEIYEVIHLTTLIDDTIERQHHLETNGDILMNYTMFNYVCFSPKELRVAKSCEALFNMVENYDWGTDFDIKVVTDLETNKELIPYATMLMPLTVDVGGPIDIKNEQKVWNYCVKNNIPFCLRTHVKVWQGKKGV